MATGIGLAFQLATLLGEVSQADTDRVIGHLNSVGLPGEMSMLNRKLSAARLMHHMSRDKKMRDGAIHLILPRCIGQCHTTSTTPPDLIRQTLLAAGCTE